MTHGILLVDCQNDFCPGGSLAVPRGDVVCASITEHLEAFSYDTIIASKDRHSENTENHFSETPDWVDTFPQHCMAGTDGADFHANLKTKLIDMVFYKGYLSAAFSAFEGWNVGGVSTLAFLKAKNVETLDICGIATEYCVKASVLDACKLGFKVRVLKSLCAHLSETGARDAFMMMTEAGATIL